MVSPGITDTQLGTLKPPTSVGIAHVPSEVFRDGPVPGSVHIAGGLSMAGLNVSGLIPGSGSGICFYRKGVVD